MIPSRQDGNGGSLAQLCCCAGRRCDVCASSTLSETLVLAAEVANSTSLVQVRLRVCVINSLFRNEQCYKRQNKGRGRGMQLPY